MRPAVAAAALILAGWLLWLALRAMSLQVFEERNPQIMAQLWPPAPQTLLKRAVRDPGGAAIAGEVMAKIARIAPLAPEPYLYAADRATARGDLRLATRFLEAARLRAPRVALVHLKLLDLQYRTGQAARAINSADRVMRLSSNAAVVQQLATAIGSLATTPESRAALARALARKPRWRVHYIRAAQSIAADPQLVFDLIENETERDPRRVREAEQTAFLNAMVARGEYDLARLAFLNFLPPSFTSTGAVYDADFRGEPGPPPFNWKFLSTRGSAASIRFDGADDDGYLLVETSGRRGPAVATQLLTLPPGRYVLATSARRAGGRGQAPSWRLDCARGRRTLAELAPHAESETFRETRVAFTVPDACGAQALRLQSRTNGDTIDLAIDWVRVAGVGGGA